MYRVRRAAHRAIGSVEALQRLRIALDNGDQDEAIRIAHTLKGLGATIGAKALNEHAAELETALRNGEMRAKPLGATETALDEVIACLARLSRSGNARSFSPKPKGNPSHSDTR